MNALTITEHSATNTSQRTYGRPKSGVSSPASSRSGSDVPTIPLQRRSRGTAATSRIAPTVTSAPRLHILASGAAIKPPNSPPSSPPPPMTPNVRRASRGFDRLAAYAQNCDIKMRP